MASLLDYVEAHDDRSPSSFHLQLPVELSWRLQYKTNRAACGILAEEEGLESSAFRALHLIRVHAPCGQSWIPPSEYDKISELHNDNKDQAKFSEAFTVLLLRHICQMQNIGEHKWEVREEVTNSSVHQLCT